MNADDFLTMAELYRQCVCGGTFVGNKHPKCNKCGLKLVSRYDNI